MSERVLHKFQAYRVINDELDNARLVFKSIDGSWNNVTCPYGVAAELAHLTARVAELEAKNAKLRACVVAADRVESGFFRNALHWETWREYRAARAEVDK